MRSPYSFSIHSTKANAIKLKEIAPLKIHSICFSILRSRYPKTLLDFPPELSWGHFIPGFIPTEDIKTLVFHLLNPF